MVFEHFLGFGAFLGFLSIFWATNRLICRLDEISANSSPTSEQFANKLFEKPSEHFPNTNSNDHPNDSRTVREPLFANRNYRAQNPE